MSIPQGRILAIDIGQKRVGLAISDELQITARPLKILDRRNWKRLLSDIAAILNEFDAKSIVIGLPINMDGTIGTAAEEVMRLTDNFRKSLKVPVYLQDERLSTKEALENLKQSGTKGSKIREYVDSQAATVILQDFLASSQNP
jgi:putative holliday junction resolvase